MWHIYQMNLTSKGLMNYEPKKNPTIRKILTKQIISISGAAIMRFYYLDLVDLVV